jgi:hypothetical protein
MAALFKLDSKTFKISLKDSDEDEVRFGIFRVAVDSK